MQNRKLYAAYGSNMNVEQMKCRTRDAVIVGWGVIENYELEFRFYANILESIGGRVPVVVWSITERDEVALDRYEGVASGLYHKEKVKVKLEGVNRKVAMLNHEALISGIEALVYTMNIESKPKEAPPLVYFEEILEGYHQNKVNVYSLVNAANKVGTKINNNKFDSPESV